jgi:CATRA-associated small protein
MPTIDDDDRNELRLTLGVVPGWKLSHAGWRSIQSSLDGVRDALERNDRISFFRHLEEIDRAAPARLARLSPDAGTGGGDSSSPPETVLELVNSLVHAPDQGARGAAP